MDGVGRREIPRMDGFARDGRRRYLIASDPHFYEEHDNRYTNQQVVDTLETIGDVYDCDELVVAGDIGDADDLDTLLEADFDVTRAVHGNHDRWEDRYDGRHTVENGATHRVYGDRLEWRDRTQYSFAMGVAHQPSDFRVRAMTRYSTDAALDPYHIIVHGHSHVVNIRRLNPDTIAIGGGSVKQEWHYADDEDLPERSVVVLETNGQVDVQQLDFDWFADHSASTGSPVVERVQFDRTPDGFHELGRVENWDSPVKFAPRA